MVAAAQRAFTRRDSRTGTIAIAPLHNFFPMTETRSRRRKRDDTDNESASAQLPAKRRQTSTKNSDAPTHATGPLIPVLPPTVVAPQLENCVDRDPEFYREDGNCILHFENMLFKVHRHYLSLANEGSVFTNLLALPMILEGDTVQELRAFFGYAYASPLQQSVSRIADGDLQQLIETARFTHKYWLDCFERWAKETISTLNSRSERRALKECPPQVLVSILELNKLSRIPQLQRGVADTRVWRLGQCEEWPQDKIALMLDVGHRLSLRSFLGSVYYEQLKRVNIAQFAAYLVRCPFRGARPVDLEHRRKM
ncbi:hypothetical protein DFH09DRAFT_1360072 [Mycena vulgaris]|nr:hypothetical protein DFH09DRAFT_1360072 [Mycena vulgaris]